jgi:3-methyladenine DNA glycosylase
MPDPARCTWARGSSDLMLRYHDGEWGVPCHDDRTLFELLTLEGAQAGLSWCGFRFVGTTICYAFMQATGLVDDHEVGCFRHSA